MDILAIGAVFILAALVGVYAHLVLRRKFVDSGAVARQREEDAQKSRDAQRDARRKSVGELGDKVSSAFGVSTQTRRSLTVKLRQAGLDVPVSTFYGIQVLCLLGFALLGLAFALLMGGSDTAHRVAILLAFLFVGAFLPRYYLAAKARKRSEIIQASFAGVLELLSIVVGAGRTVEQGFRDVAKRADGPLADEFGIVDRDIRYYRYSTEEALRRMADRCQVRAIDMFAAAVAQSAAKGTEIGEVLKQQAATARDNYYMDLEEKSNKIRTKMIIPTLTLIMPPVFIISLGPAIMTLADEFGQLLG